MKEMLYYQIGGANLPYVKYINQVTIEPPHIHIRRQTEEFILYFILSGEMHINEGNRPYILKPNDLLILDPALEHYGTKSTTCTYFYIHFYHKKMKECSADVDSIKDMLIKYRLASLKTHEGIYLDINNTRMLLPKLYHISQPGTSIALIDLLNKMKESHYNRQEHNQLNTSCIMMKFLIALSRELTSGFQYHGISVSAMRSTRLIHDLLSFFQSSYATEITGKFLEEKFNYNFDHMNRIFKKATGATIFAYLNDLRISKAKQMLSSGIGKISEVSEQSGFRDVYYFSKVFKKLTGITPAAYARRNN